MIVKSNTVVHAVAVVDSSHPSQPPYYITYNAQPIYHTAVSLPLLNNWVLDL